MLVQNVSSTGLRHPVSVDYELIQVLKYLDETAKKYSCQNYRNSRIIYLFAAIEEFTIRNGIIEIGSK